MVKTTKGRAAGQKTLITLAKRIDIEKQLARGDGNWVDVVAAEEGLVVNGGLRGVLVILAIAYHRAFRRWLDGKPAREDVEGPSAGGNPAHGHARYPPNSRSASDPAGDIRTPAPARNVSGVAGAGLTVALKDFIIGFFGLVCVDGKERNPTGRLGGD